MINRLKYLAGLAGLTGLLALVAPLPVAAANATPIPAAPTGITVSPAFQQVSISSDEAVQPVSFTITNNTAVTQDLSLSTADFNTLSESGGLFFVGTNPTQLQKKYGLAKWVSLPQTQLVLAPKQTQTINANILNLADLSPGGHYGALMLSIGDNATNPNKISLHPIASSLMFVTKLGGDTHLLKLAGVYVSHTLLKLPSSVTLRFQDVGNTHLIPRGVVTITGPDGTAVARGIINEDSSIILPQTYRRYAVPLQTLASASRPGKYYLRVDFRFDGYSQFRGYQQSFVLVPLANIIEDVVLAAILIAATGLVFKPALRRKVLNKLFKH